MSASSGTRLGPYEIVAPIGAGGMGEVYRAKDTRLGREVALKVLPASFSQDADRLRRFEGEAKAASLLNHPNITAVYDVGQHDGCPYVVSELLEGETLRSALSGGKLSPRRATDYAIGLARGLAAAHEKGIVHRDLKPENAFITADGQVKILDFGLAKLTQTDAAGPGTNIPTATEPGVVMGTLGYMSPEQVRGKPADHRSDIFSFGAILYEMLSGQRAFQRDSAADTMSAILKEDPPDLSVTNQSVSPALDRIVRHCLEKSPERRVHSAHDLAFDLETLSQSSGKVTPEKRPARFRALPLLLATGALIAAGGGFLLGRRAPANGTAAESAPRSYRALTHLPGAEASPSLSPDGRLLAFVKKTNGKSDVWVQRTGGQNATNLTAATCDKDAYSPAFSPDGNLVAYAADCGGGGLFVIGATGENNRRLSEIGSDPTWSPDAREIVYNTESGWAPSARTTTSELWIAEVATGKSRKVYDGDAVQPAVSPHGLRIAFWGLPHGGSQRDIWTIPYAGPAKGEKAVPVTSDAALDWNPKWSADGRYLYFLSDRSGSMNLWRVPIDEKTGRTTGPFEARTLPAQNISGFSLASAANRLAYVSDQFAFSIDRLPFDNSSGTATGQPVEIFQSAEPADAPNVSPDGSVLLFDTQGSSQEDLLTMRSDGTGLRKLTDDPPRDRIASFSPDGKRIVFQSDRSGTWEIWTIQPDGSGLKQLTNEHKGLYIALWSPDGRRIAASTGANVFLLELGADGAVARSTPVPDPPNRRFPIANSWIDGDRLLVVLERKEFASLGTLAIYSLAKNTYEELRELPQGRFGATFAAPRWILYPEHGGIMITDLARSAPRVLVPAPKNGEYPFETVAPKGDVIYLEHIHENADIWEATNP